MRSVFNVSVLAQRVTLLTTLLRVEQYLSTMNPCEQEYIRISIVHMLVICRVALSKLSLTVLVLTYAVDFRVAELA